MSELTQPAAQPEERPAYLRLIIMAVLVVVALAAIFVAPSLDPKARAGEPLDVDAPAPVAGTPSLPDPAEHGVEGATTEDEVIAAVLRYDREQTALEQARTDGDISSECTPEGDGYFNCTVTFKGQPVTSRIFVEDVSSLSMDVANGTHITDTIRFSVEEEQVVVTREAILEAMRSTVRDSVGGEYEVTNPRCDADIPEVQVFDVSLGNSPDAEGNCFANRTGWRAWPNWSTTYVVAAHPTGPSLYHK